jgi:hypothetical protein
LRTDYLTALAARTLGATPMLRPATPSRFEPEGPQAQLREVVEIHEAESNLTTATRPAPGRADEQLADTAAATHRPDRSLLGSDHHGKRLAMAASAQGWEAPDISDLAADPAETAGHRRPIAPRPPGTPDLEPSADAGTAPPGSVPRRGRVAPSMASDDGRSRGRADLADTALPPPETPGSRVAWHVDVTQVARSRQQPQAGDRATESAGTPSTGPAVIVRIGRVDVRAVPAASPPAPPSRARPPAGPSLEEHLLARDRRRR